jgi:hypothetical protein
VATITLVQCDVEDTASLQAAMSGVQMVVSAIGAPESQPLDSSLPSRIDGQGGKNLVDAGAVSLLRLTLSRDRAFSHALFYMGCELALVQPQRAEWSTSWWCLR